MHRVAEALLSHPNPVHILRIDVARTAPLQFEKTFSVNAQTNEELKKISDIRKEVVAASTAVYCGTAIIGVQKYLPSLFGLMAAVEKFPPEFSKALIIAWTSPLSAGYYNQELKGHSNWLFEVILVLLTYGLLHRKDAMEKLAKIPEENFDEHCPEPAKILREAAGIFEYVAQEGSAKFFVSPDDIPFPEIQSVALTMLSDISLAESQQIFIRKGILGKRAPSALAKLCSGVFSLYSHAKESFDKILKSKYMVLNNVIEKYITLNRDLHSAMALKYQAIHLNSISSPGLAVAYIRKAKNIMSKLNFPKMSGPYSDDCILFWKKCEKEIELINHICVDFERDNNEVYHERVADDSQVVMPESVLLAKSLPFIPPEKVDIQLTPQSSCNIL